VVAIVGQKSRKSVGGSNQQEVDLVSLFKDVAGAYVQQAADASQVRHLLDRAMRIAQAERTVTALSFATRYARNLATAIAKGNTAAASYLGNIVKDAL
jgi:thiamine pyrophosphate-dependent acetolactate synthase large subunit-like protein